MALLDTYPLASPLPPSLRSCGPGGEAFASFSAAALLGTEGRRSRGAACQDTLSHVVNPAPAQLERVGRLREQRAAQGAALPDAPPRTDTPACRQQNP